MMGFLVQNTLLQSTSTEPFGNKAEINRNPLNAKARTVSPLLCINVLE